MILDSSAIVAIATEEPGCLELVDKLNDAPSLGIGTPTLVETALVLRSRLASEPRGFLERFLTDWTVTVVPFGEEHWKTAADAHARYGRGRHTAALNFGDCLSYATAKLAGMPLLCTGSDFARTDIALACEHPQCDSTTGPLVRLRRAGAARRATVAGAAGCAGPSAGSPPPSSE